MSLIHVSKRRRGAGTRHIAVQPNPEQDALTVALHFEDAQANMLPTQTLARKLLPGTAGPKLVKSGNTVVYTDDGTPYLTHSV